MNILFTGCTSKQTNDDAWKRARIKRIDDSTIIVDSLRKSGHNVDRKRIEWGDDLSKYDLGIVGIGSFGSNNYSGDIINAIYALGHCKNVLVFHEDWKIHNTMNSMEKMLDLDIFEKTLSKKWSSGENFYGGLTNGKFDAEKAYGIISDLSEGKFDSLVPAFQWGDKQKVKDIVKSNNVYNVDLTPYVLEGWNINLNPESVPKMKKHMLASLVDHTSWVKRNRLSWEVDYFGAKSLKAPILESETEVFEKCNEYWGILCPEYPHSGSGWFRIRYIYAALNKSIIVGSDNDMDGLGIPNVDIEKLSDLDLGDYAYLQSETILSHSWSKDDFDKNMNDYVNKARIGK